MERNIDEYVSFANDHDVDLRHHAKTHKNADIAALQIKRSGGGGIMCQTIGEVETMAENGISDIYLSYHVVGEKHLERLVVVSEKLDTFATTVDGMGNIEPLQEAAADHGVEVGVLLELDLGYHRTGVEPGAAAVELAREIDSATNLDFRGLLAYDAHVKATAESREDYRDQCWEAMETTQRTVKMIEEAGIPVDEVEAGGTSTSRYSGRHPVVTEINPGMYPFNDVRELRSRPFEMSKDDCAATGLTTVISNQAPDRVIVDAGNKTFSLDSPRMPVPKHRDDIEYEKASEEHGWIDTSDSSTSFEVGDRIEFIVPHVCTTFNLHDTIVGHRNGFVERVWKIQARGQMI